MLYHDISIEEEASLPLPPGWVRSIKLNGKLNSSYQQPQKIYKNINTGQEIEEHPIIAKAMNAAKKIPLPFGWSFREVKGENGSTEVFFVNLDLKISMWEHPLLRSCVSECLEAHGLDPFCIQVHLPPEMDSFGDEFDNNCTANALLVKNRPQDFQQLRSPSTYPLPKSPYISDFESPNVLREFESNETSLTSIYSTPVAPGLQVEDLNQSVPIFSDANENFLSEHTNRVANPSSAAIPKLSLEIFHPETVYAPEQQDKISSQQLLHETAKKHDQKTSSTVDNFVSAVKDATKYENVQQPPAQVHFSHIESTTKSVSDVDDSIEDEIKLEITNEIYPEPIEEETADQFKPHYSDIVIHPVEESDLSHAMDDIESELPPASIAGVRALNTDVVRINRIVHEMLTDLRAELAIQLKMKCKFISKHGESISSDEEEGLASLRDNSDADDALTNATMIDSASSIISMIRERANIVILTLVNNLSLGSVAVLQAAFIVIHRILHPLSTDVSYTTALLLEGINHQLSDFATLRKDHINVDNQALLARCLYISDAIRAADWDPMREPIPTVPRIDSETIFCSMMRLYSIRRDVSSYFRAIWRPVLSSSFALITNPISRSSPTLFKNLISIADRFMEFTFHENSMTGFPISGSAILRALSEIGGSDLLATTLINIFILPNLVKVLCSDHDSIENESPFRISEMSQKVNKFFAHDWWYASKAPADETNLEMNSLDMVQSTLWIIWRLFSCAMYLTEMQIRSLTLSEFCNNRLSHLNFSSYGEEKLRIIVARVKRKVGRGLEWLSRMPLDVHGCKYLGLEYGRMNDDLAINHETSELLERRIFAIQFRPAQMQSISILSRYELSSLFADIGCMMDEKAMDEKDSLYEAISYYLSSFETNQSETVEELVELEFPQALQSDLVASSAYDSMNSIQLSEEQRRLSRGLRSLKRHRLALMLILQKARDKKTSNLQELLMDVYWRQESNIDLELKSIKQHEISLKHTAASQQKLRQPMHGLKTERSIAAFPLFGAHVDHGHPSTMKSMKEIQQDIIKSYRFGSAQAGVDAGTSLARGKVMPPSLTASKIKVTTVKRDGEGAGAKDGSHATRGRSKFTRSNVNENASFLAPTTSFKHLHDKEPESQRDLEKGFMTSMRSYSVIPTEEFQMRYFRRRKTWFTDTNTGSAEEKEHVVHSLQQKTVSNAQKSISAVSKPIQTPQPFPEHLRHRVRGDSLGEEYIVEIQRRPGASAGFKRTGASDNALAARLASLHEVLEGRAEFRGSVSDRTDHFQSERGAVDNDAMKDLIHDYHSAVPAERFADRGGAAASRAGQSNAYESRKAAIDRSASPSAFSASRSRPRSPALPTPLGNTNLVAPTQSLLHRMRPPERSEQFDLDLKLHKLPESRKYEPNDQSAQHELDFFPTMSKLYPATGPRIPRVPDFLNPIPGEHVVYARNRPPSPGGAPTRSRSNSPTMTVGRRSSLTMPTLASVQSMTDEAAAKIGVIKINPLAVEVQVEEEREERERAKKAAEKAAAIERAAADKSALEKAAAAQKANADMIDSFRPLRRASMAAAAVDDEGISNNVPFQRTSNSPNQTFRRSSVTAVLSGLTPPVVPAMASAPSSAAVDEHADTAPSARTKSPSAGRRASSASPSSSSVSSSSSPKSQRRMSSSPALSKPANLPDSADSYQTSRTTLPSRRVSEFFREQFAEASKQAAAEEEEEEEGDKAKAKAKASNYFVSFDSDTAKRNSVNINEDRAKSLQQARQQTNETNETSDVVENESASPRLIGNESMEGKPVAGKPAGLSQQKSTITDSSAALNILSQGFIAQKFGRSGGPKQKTIRYNEAGGEITWSAPGNANARKSSIRSFFGGQDKKGPSSIMVETVTEVRKGPHTDIFQRAGLVDPNCCLSLITPDRSLDLLLPTSAERNTIVRGLRALFSDRPDVLFT